MVLATVHIALAEVPRTLTGDRLESVVMLAAAELPRFGRSRARLAVARILARPENERSRYLERNLLHLWPIDAEED